MRTEKEILDKIKQLKENADNFGKVQRCYMQTMENTKIETLKWVLEDKDE